jgi:hypothetical protein
VRAVLQRIAVPITLLQTRPRRAARVAEHKARPDTNTLPAGALSQRPMPSRRMWVSHQYVRSSEDEEALTGWSCLRGRKMTRFSLTWFRIYVIEDVSPRVVEIYKCRPKADTRTSSLVTVRDVLKRVVSDFGKTHPSSALNILKEHSQTAVVCWYLYCYEWKPLLITTSLLNMLYLDIVAC